MKQRLNSLRHQAGMALVFAMIALVILTMGAVALIRSVDTNVLALGNLAFKQSALVSAARGTDAAMDWLAANMGTATLNNDQVAQGYYATSLDALDPTGRTVGTAAVLAQVDWDGNGCQGTGTPSCLTPSAEIKVNGDTVRYIIARLCNASGDPNATVNPPLCAVPPVAAKTESAGMNGGLGLEPNPNTAYDSYNPYYRVVTRTVNPKGTVSFTETLAHF